ncbi:MAG: hypothetical protein GY803_07275, partial [Chloroflexi bacterium]|nr:hypothetical protein [Chloroflexota bacterium]
MGVALDELTDRLKSEVAAVDGIPTNGQYQNAVKDAVAALSMRVGSRKQHQISVVSGTAVYTLPDDFVREIKLEPLESGAAKYGDTLIISGSLYPALSGS